MKQSGGKIIKRGVQSMVIQKNQETFLLKIIRYGIYLLLFIPLLSSELFLFPEIVPKAIFFRLIVDLIFIFYVFLTISNHNYSFRLNILNITIIIFWIILIVSSIFGANLEKSFWGNFKRMDGLITISHLMIFFIIASCVFKKREEWEKIFKISILSSILTIILIFFSDKLSIINGGTLGNSSFLASYLFFNAFFSLIIFVKEKKFWKIIYGLIFIIISIIIIKTECQGVIVASATGFILSILGYLVFLQKIISKKKILIIITTLIIVGAIFSFVQLEFIKNKFKEILEKPTLQARFLVWNMGWQGWKEKLFLGWGLENFEVVFNKYFNQKLYFSKYGAEGFFDKAHNIIIDMGVSSGIIGVLSYMSIFFIIIFTFLKICKKKPDKQNIVFLGGIIIILISYFLQNLLLFDTINGYIMFFLILAFSSRVLEEKKLEEGNFYSTENKEKFISKLGGILLILTIINIYFCVIQPAKAAFYIKKSSYFSEESINFFQKAIKAYSPSRMEAIYYFPEDLHRDVSRFDKNLFLMERDFQIIEREAEKVAEKNPLDSLFLLKLATIYNDFYKISLDKEKLNLAESVLKKAINISPKNPAIYWVLSDTMFYQGKYQDQLLLLQKAIDLEPKLAESHWYLAIGYRISGFNDLAIKKEEEIKKRNDLVYGGNPRELLIIRVFYCYNRNTLNCLYILKKLIKNNLKELIDFNQNTLITDYNNWGSWMDATYIYGALGEKEKEEDAKKKMLEFMPSLYYKYYIEGKFDEYLKKIDTYQI